MVGIEFEANAGEADLICRKNNVKVKISSEGASSVSL